MTSQINIYRMNAIVA